MLMFNKEDESKNPSFVVPRDGSLIVKYDNNHSSGIFFDEEAVVHMIAEWIKHTDAEQIKREHRDLLIKLLSQQKQQKVITILLFKKKIGFDSQEVYIDIANRLDANGLAKIPVDILPSNYKEEDPHILRIQIVIEDEFYTSKLTVTNIEKALHGLLEKHDFYSDMQITIN